MHEELLAMGVPLLEIEAKRDDEAGRFAEREERLVRATRLEQRSERRMRRGQAFPARVGGICRAT
jgi:hypothetical protein